MINAATVYPTEATDSPLQLLDKKPTAPTKAPVIEDKNTSTEQTDDTIKKQLETNTQSRGDYFFNPPAQSSQQDGSKQQKQPELSEFIEKLISEYEDNELVQQSLSTLYEVQQIWNNAELQVNAFAADIIFSLELEEIIERDLINKIQISLQSPAASAFLNINYNFSEEDIEEKNIIYDQVLQANTASQDLNLSNVDLNKMTLHFLASIFSITTIYYLIAAITFVSLIRWTVNFLLRLFP